MWPATCGLSSPLHSFLPPQRAAPRALEQETTRKPKRDMIRKAVVNLRLLTRTQELCHSERPHSTRFAHATTIQRIASSLVNPSPAPRAEPAAVVDRGGTGSGFVVETGPATSPIPTTLAPGSRKTGVRAPNVATSAASNGAGNAWPTARVIGVSEADPVGGNGGGNSSNRCYWALDDAQEARRGRFVAQPHPPQTMEVGQYASQVE